MSLVNVICPTDCTYEVPIISMDECNPFVDFDEVDHVYLTAIDGELDDWTDLAEWIARLLSTDPEPIRDFHVSGELPKPEYNTVKISLKREVESEKKFVLNAMIDETNTINYDAARQLQCHGRYLMWFSAGRFMYGGTDGIEVNIQINPLITKGNEELNLIEMILSWYADHHPERIDNPLI